MRIFGSISRLVSVLFRKDGYDITVRPNQATTYTAARDAQLPPGDADAVLVGAASTQTLTNKTLGAGTVLNATTVGAGLTNIANEHIKLGAAIEAGKIAGGAVQDGEYNQLVGLSSPAVGTTQAQTLTNKTINADLNTITNIDNADIKAAAGIVESKLSLDYPTATLNTSIQGRLATTGGTMSGSLSMGSNQITSLAAPSIGTDAANKNYVDNAINGLSWKSPVAVATTANITLSGEQTIDGVLTSASRVLVKDQSTTSQNGIYVSAAGAWARSEDMNSLSPLDEVNGAACFVLGGTVGGDKAFVQTATVATLGADALAFAQFSSASSYVGGTGITITGNSIATNDSAIVHDNLSGFVANEHIDHSTVSMVTGSTSGLTDGGNITSNFSPKVAPERATAGTVAAADEILFADVSAGNALRKTTAADIAALAAGSASQAFTWTDGSATKVCTHTFATDDVLVELYDSTSKETVYADFVDRTGTNEVTVTRSEATVGSNWRVVIRN